MPNRVLVKAHQAKKADLEHITHRVALILAEIKSAERQKDFLLAICEEYKEELSVSEVQMNVVAMVLDRCGLTEAEDDRAYYRALYTDELTALTISEGQAIQMEEGVQSWVETWSVLDIPDDNEFSNEDSELPFTGLLSSDDSVF